MYRDAARFVIGGALLMISLVTIQTFTRDGNLLGPLIAMCMFGGGAGFVITRLRRYTLTVLINGVGISANISDTLYGLGQLYRWEEIGSVIVRPINIKREFGKPGAHFAHRATLKGIRFYGRKFSYIWDGTEAIELRTRDGRIAIITVSDGNAVRAALEAAGHPAS